KAKIRIEEFEREASALRFETEQYKSKMVEALERGKTLEEKCADAQQLMSQLQEAQEVNQNLRNEKRDLQAKYQKEIEGFKELEKINFQSKVQQSNDINFQEAESAKKINQQFSEQNKFVQVELVKARARAQGLERICTDYQAQIEELLKKAHGAVRGVS
ncbi:MAG: hypothetical protein NT079_06920, partial [Candidatus Omnitrophica bacterium]|nr:hypothetical protein [Candidatus Omnitrophota bacterium]